VWVVRWGGGLGGGVWGGGGGVGVGGGGGRGGGGVGGWGTKTAKSLSLVLGCGFAAPCSTSREISSSGSEASVEHRDRDGPRRIFGGKLIGQMEALSRPGG